MRSILDTNLWATYRREMKNMKHPILSLSFIAYLMVPSLALAEDKGQAVKEKAKETVTAVKEYTKDEKEKVQKDLQAQIEKMKSEMSSISDSVKGKTAEAKKSVDSKLKEMNLKREELEKDLSSLKKSSGRAWDKLRAGIQDSVKGLQNAISKAKDEFNKTN